MRPPCFPSCYSVNISNLFRGYHIFQFTWHKQHQNIDDKKQKYIPLLRADNPSHSLGTEIIFPSGIFLTTSIDIEAVLRGAKQANPKKSSQMAHDGKIGLTSRFLRRIFLGDFWLFYDSLQTYPWDITFAGGLDRYFGISGVYCVRNRRNSQQLHFCFLPKKPCLLLSSFLGFLGSFYFTFLISSFLCARA